MIEFEKDHDVAAMLDEALGLFNDHFGDLDVAHGGLVEGRGDDFAMHRALHVGDFLGALVDQQHDQIAFGVIGGDRLRDVLQQHRFAGAGRRDDEGALALADRRDDIDDAGGKILARRIVDFEFQALVGIERRQIVEMDLVADLLRILEIDGVDFQKREIALPFLRAADKPFDGVAGAQAKAADLRGRDIDVVRARKIIGVGRTQEAEAVLQHLDDAVADDLDVAAGELFEDRKHQFLFAHDRSVFDFVFFGETKQFCGRLELQVLQLYFPHGDDVLGDWRGFVSRGYRKAVAQPNPERTGGLTPKSGGKYSTPRGSRYLQPANPQEEPSG